MQGGGYTREQSVGFDYDAVDERLGHVETQRNDYREAGKEMLQLLNSAMAHVIMSKHPSTAAWQVAFGLGLPCCEGMSMDRVAAELRVERATLSKGAVNFCKAYDLPPSEYMRSEPARQAYRARRESQLVQPN
jgi:hypothetical protein